MIYFIHNKLSSINNNQVLYLLPKCIPEAKVRFFLNYPSLRGTVTVTNVKFTQLFYKEITSCVKYLSNIFSPFR